jgi:redox-sensing transcriptional repressor
MFYRQGESMSKNTIPDIVVSRLPLYLQLLQNMANEGITNTSSKEMGEKLGISAAQIRKDLSLFGGYGKQGTGYAIKPLSIELQTILNINQIWDIAVIGAGDLGHAIAQYRNFSTRGFRIVLVFDNDPQKVGSAIGDLNIQSMDNLEELIHEAEVKIAMLTVPAKVAQEVTNKLVKAGIRGILNYAPTSLKVPDDVHVQNIDPSIQLQHMTYYLE